MSEINEQNQLDSDKTTKFNEAKFALLDAFDEVFPGQSGDVGTIVEAIERFVAAIIARDRA